MIELFVLRILLWNNANTIKWRKKEIFGISHWKCRFSTIWRWKLRMSCAWMMKTRQKILNISLECWTPSAAFTRYAYIIARLSSILIFIRLSIPARNWTCYKLVEAGPKTKHFSKRRSWNCLINCKRLWKKMHHN